MLINFNTCRLAFTKRKLTCLIFKIKIAIDLLGKHPAIAVGELIVIKVYCHLDHFTAPSNNKC